ncbi:MAG: hypothetical protein EOM68_31985 [Spirochaetia bacterium]|nr:hypothetical protein [Spirochaetia bacterium]
MKLTLVDTKGTENPIRLRIETPTTITTYNPSNPIDMALLTQKMIGLSSLSGRIEVGFLNSVSRIAYQGTTHIVEFDGEITVLQTAPLQSARVATLTTRTGITDMTLADLHLTLRSRIEKIQSALITSSPALIFVDEMVIGTFPDRILTNDQNL